MNKHTPGPWRVTKTIGETPAIESDHDQHFSVAIVPRKGPEMHANARLIAAAPDLLEFAEEVRRTGDTRLASMAIATIAKATGEQP